MEAYLDNSATTRCADEVCRMVQETMSEAWGNPSSMHGKGVQAERYVREATRRIAATLKADEREVYYTSGGTESDNWALIGTALARQRRGKHLIITSMEHPAVTEAAKFLETQGFEVTILPADRGGRIALGQVQKAVRPDTILVSVMYVNNEIGTVEPVDTIGRWLKKEYPETVFHVDAVQAYGKYRINPKKSGIDLLSASGHKIHGPKGVGFLYVRKQLNLLPILYGGGQQGGMRSGTDNVPGIAGLGMAAELAYQNLEEDVRRMDVLRQQLAEGIAAMNQTVLHDPGEGFRAPHIVHASFPGVRSEVLLHSLEERGIYVSAGSACSTHKKNKSPVMAAIGANAAERESAVRFSLSAETTAEEIEYTLRALTELVPALRRYTRS